VQSIKDCGTDIDKALAILATFRSTSSPERAAEVTRAAVESNNGKVATQQRQKNGNIRQQHQQQQQHASPINNARKNPASNYGKGFNNYHVPTPTTARAASVTAAESKSKDKAVLLRAYNAILHACSENREMEKVLDLFKQMREVDQVTPDVISYRRAIFTCAKAELWKPALAFLQEMEANVIIPDVKCYCAVITACGRGI
jgi:pentatricopeptide repeat protein